MGTRETVSRACLVAVMAGSLAALVWTVTCHPMFNIRHVDITAKADRMTMLEIHEVINRSMSGNFFTQDIDLLRTNLEAESWVKKAEVNRIWPDRLAVRLTEHKPVAIWDDGRLISAEGILFTSNDTAIEDLVSLPLVGGDVVKVEDAVRYLPEFEKAARRMNGRIKSVQISFRGSWRVVVESTSYPDLTIELGRSTTEAKPVERLNRVASYHDEIVERMTGYPTFIDTRYPSSLAIRKPTKENYERWARDRGQRSPFEPSQQKKATKENVRG